MNPPSVRSSTRSTRPLSSAVRFAVWAAVSTPAQARKDKGRSSLDKQLEECRAAALAKGWIETAGPFIVAGQSRTRWIELTAAMKAIPALDSLIQSVRRHEMDVVVTWDETRFRSLLPSVAAVLEDSRVQMYSLASRVEPVSPADYDPDEADAAQIVQDANAMASRLEGKFRKRRWRSSMVARVESGLHYGSVPFGYRKPPGHEFDPGVVLEPDPEKARLVVQLKDLLLSGRSLSQLMDFLNASGVRPPLALDDTTLWNHSTVRRLLVNPFYAGLTFMGRRPTHRDRLTGRIIQAQPDSVDYNKYPGKHPALWTEADLAAIRGLFRSRGRAFAGRRTHVFSQILRCSLCGGVLWCHRNTKTHLHYFRCHIGYEKHEPGHAHIAESKILRIAGPAIAEALQQDNAAPARPDENRRSQLRAQQQDLLARRKRWMDAFESGMPQAPAFTERIAELEAQLEAIRRDLEVDLTDSVTRSRRRGMIAALAQDPETLPGYLRHADAQEANATLREIVDHITVRPDQTIAVELRK